MTDPTAAPGFEQLAPRVEQLYRLHPTGGCLHIVLDDCNIEDSHVRRCMELALERHEFWQAGIALDLLRTSERTRERLFHMPKERW